MSLRAGPAAIHLLLNEDSASLHPQKPVFASTLLPSTDLAFTAMLKA